MVLINKTRNRPLILVTVILGLSFFLNIYQGLANNRKFSPFLIFPFDRNIEVYNYPDDGTPGKTYGDHEGIDYLASMGTPIYAAADGEVYEVNDGCEDDGGKLLCEGGRGYGNHVVISHSNSLHSIYGHMQKWSVKTSGGAFVKAGDLIGLVGNSGRSTASHLHFEISTTPVFGGYRNPYNLNTGCLFIDGCEAPILPSKVSSVDWSNIAHQSAQPKVSLSSNPEYSISNLGWLDAFPDAGVEPESAHISAGSYDGGSRDGLHFTSKHHQNTILYHEVWQESQKRREGKTLERLYRMDRGKGKVSAMVSGDFMGDGRDYLARVISEGDYYAGPANVELMYAPEIYSRTAGRGIVVD